MTVYLSNRSDGNRAGYKPVVAGTNVTITEEEAQVTLAASGGGGSFQFPVGAIYIETTGANPATTFGYGTWVQRCVGKFVVGLGADPDFDTVGETGGSKTHTHVGHDNHVVTQPDDHAAHTHLAGTLVNSTVTGSRKGGTSGAATLTDSHTHTITGNTDNPSASLTHSGANVDTHSAHDSPSHLPPFEVLGYFWERTA